MRFVRIATSSGPRLGVLRADDLVAVSPSAGRLEDHFGAGFGEGEALRRLGERILASPADEVGYSSAALLAPVGATSLRDFMVFEEHVLPTWRRQGRERGPDVWYEQPVGYFSNVATLLGPQDAVPVPGGSSRLDFELEVAAVVGREARSVAPDDADALIAGFLILCDWSARDLQAREMEGRLGPFKGKDFASSLGPVFVTPDELADRRADRGYDLAMTAAVSGREYGRDRWSSAYWSFGELLSYASWNSIVEAGAVLGSGTCQGGCILELSNRHGSEAYPWLAPGDEVTLSIERLGELRARIQEPARGAWPGLRAAPLPV